MTTHFSTLAWKIPWTEEPGRLSGLPFPPPGDLPNPGIEPMCPELACRFFTTEPLGKPHDTVYHRILMS